jgi:hypothetical protein
MTIGVLSKVLETEAQVRQDGCCSGIARKSVSKYSIKLSEPFHLSPSELRLLGVGRDDTRWFWVRRRTGGLNPVTPDLYIGGVMSTKKIIIKWLLICYFVALLPTWWYIAGCTMILCYWFSKVLGVFNALLPMPKFRIYFGLLRRQYMINKMKIKGGTP